MFGISSLWLLTPLPPELINYDFGVLAACSAFGALLPDLDASESKIKHLRLLGTNVKPFLLPAQIIYKTDRHRGLLHSLPGYLMICLIFTPLCVFGWSLWFAVILGYGSHLLADSATKSGIMPFYPRKHRFYLLPKAWRLTTGSAAEEIWFALFAVTALALLLHSLN